MLNEVETRHFMEDKIVGREKTALRSESDTKCFKLLQLREMSSILQTCKIVSYIQWDLVVFSICLLIPIQVGGLMLKNRIRP